jgi:glycosyl transferase family 87
MWHRKIVKFYKLILAAFIAGSLVFHLAILWASRHRIAEGYGDFVIFYTGAQIINDGRSKELFKVETQNAYQAKFDVPQLEWPLPFNHAPYELFLFLPLVHLSYPVAHAIWSGLSLILLAAMLQWLLSYVQSPYCFFITASILAWFPTMETFRLGQDSVLSTALLLAVFAALKRKRDGWAGFFLALGLYKPQLVLPLAGCLLMARRWYSLSIFGVTGVVLVGISVWMVGWHGIFDFLSILRSMNRYSYIIYPANMPNIRGLVYDLLHANETGSLSFALTGMISLVAYLLCVYLWRGDFDARNSIFDLKFSLTLLTTILISYHLYPHDLLPVAITAILLFRYINTEGTSNKSLSLAFYVALLILLLPVVPRYLISSSALGWAALSILLLYGASVLEIARRMNFTINTKSSDASFST